MLFVQASRELKILIILILVSAFITVDKATAAPVPAQQKVCTSGSFPTGWVIINMGYDSGPPCGTPGGGMPPNGATNFYIIEDVSGLPVGPTSDTEVCALTPIPKGWAIIRGPSTANAICRGYSSSPSFNVEWIRRLS